MYNADNYVAFDFIFHVYFVPSFRELIYKICILSFIEILHMHLIEIHSSTYAAA